MPPEKPYFNNHQALYNGTQPAFYARQDVPGIETLEQASDAILAELAANLADPATRTRCFKKNGLKPTAGWKQIELKIYGVSYRERVSLFPKTMQAVSAINGVSTVYFSLLGPGATIKRHVGDTDAYHRVHLGLKIPGDLPGCGIMVAGESRRWREGECLAFNDIYPHSAWNHTSEERIVLIVDIIRPEFQNNAVYVESGVRASLYFSRLYLWLFPVIELLPRVITRMIFPVFHAVSLMAHYIRHRMEKSEIKKG